MSCVSRYVLPTMLRTIIALGCPPRMSWELRKTFVAWASALTSSMEALHGTSARSARSSSARLVSGVAARPIGDHVLRLLAEGRKAVKNFIGVSQPDGFYLGGRFSIQSEELCCVSQSASVTLCPCSCSQAARWTARVDLPTPPLEFATTIIMHRTIAHGLA